MDLLEKIDMFIGETFAKFDDVLIKSKNKAGMIYSISGDKVVVKTVSGMIKTTISDLKMMSEGESDGKGFPAKKKKDDADSDESAEDKKGQGEEKEDDTEEDVEDPDTDLEKEKKQKQLKKKSELTDYTPAYEG